MSTIAEAKAAIYNRLASAPTFHPSSADLFEDWTLQGGDVVSVQSDNDTYNVPIYGMKMKWNGTSKVSVQSSGKEKRPSVEKMAQEQSSPGSVHGVSNSYRAQKKRQDRIEFIVGIDEDGEYFVDNPAAITLSINEDNTTNARIRGDHIYIGDGSTQDLTIADVFEIDTFNGSKYIKVKTGMTALSYLNVLGGNLTVSELNNAGGSITGKELHVGTSGNLVFDDRNSNTTLTRSDALGLIDTFSHVGITGPDSNDEYTLWYLPANIQRTTNPGGTDWINCGNFERGGGGDASDIRIGSISRSSSEPSADATLNDLALEIRSASSGQWIKFKATIQGGTGQRWYKFQV